LNGSSILLLTVTFLLILSSIPGAVLGRDPVPRMSGLSENIVFADPGEDPHLGFDTCIPDANSTGGLQGSQAGPRGRAGLPENMVIEDGGLSSGMSLKHKLEVILYSLFGFCIH